VKSPTGDPPILVVEDDLQLRQAIELVLQDEGFSVATAADGEEGVARARAERPALVLLDWGLPILNGAAVAAAINETYGDVPIVLITADGRSVEKARQVGAREYLNKPFELDDLVDAVRRSLSPS
jgi:two-component system, chemotaxis family, chemotaxis protein CheY